MLVKHTADRRTLVTAFRAALAEVIEAMLVDVDIEERAQFARTLQQLLSA